MGNNNSKKLSSNKDVKTIPALWMALRKLIANSGGGSDPTKVPYTGATANVNLGARAIIANGGVSSSGLVTSATHFANNSDVSVKSKTKALEVEDNIELLGAQGTTFGIIMVDKVTGVRQKITIRSGIINIAPA